MKKRLIKIVIITLAVLLVPLALQLTIGTGVDGQGFNWKLGDFIFMGLLIFITGLLIDFALRKAGKYSAAAIIMILLGFFWLWVELAVGLFTNWGS